LTRRLLASLALLAALALASPAAHAKQTVGTAFSSPVDGDGAALYWNPAALSLIEGSQFYGQLNPAILYTSYARSGIDNQTNAPFQPVSFNALKPEGVVAFTLDRIHPRLRLGLGVSFPLVLGARWPDTVVTPQGQSVLGPTRYYTTYANLINVFVHLAASFKINKYLAIGGGPNLVITLVDQTQHIDFANQPPLTTAIKGNCTTINLCESATLSTPAKVSAKGFGAGATVGILFTPWDWMRIGASYISPVKQNLPASLTLDTSKIEAFVQQYLPGFKPLGLNGNGSASLTIPQSVQAAVAVNVSPRVELMGGFQWYNFAALSLIDIRITTKASNLLPDSQLSAVIRKDQFNVFGRLAVQVHERWKLALRLEYINNTVPSDFTAPNVVDWDRIDIGVYAQLKTGRHTLVLGYSHVFGITNTVTASSFGNDRPPPYNLPNPAGTYTFQEVRPSMSYAFTF
jgi:long-chain fatty acid transport protein